MYRCGLIIATVLIMTVNATAVLVDNFDSYDQGSVNDVTENWVGTVNVMIETDPDDPQNQVIVISQDPGQQKAVYGILSSDAWIPEGQTGTLFLRFRATEAIDSAWGMTDVDTPDVAGDNWSQFGPEVSVLNTDFRVRDGGSWGVAQPSTAEHWYNCWMVINNGTDSMSVYVNDRPEEAATEADRVFVGNDGDFGFRVAVNGTIDRFYWRAQQNNADRRLWIDDIYVTAGVSLANPLKTGLASSPSPSDGQTEVLLDSTLSWVPGDYAASHDVYFGTVAQDVNDASRNDDRGVLVSQGQDANSYVPSEPLTLGQTYYWRVDEVNAPASPGTYKGSLWSFTTEAYSYLVPDVNVTASVAGASDPNNLVNDPNANGTSVLDDTMWNVNPGAANEVSLDFDLGALYRLDEMRVWNFNLTLEGSGFLNFSVKDITLETSVDGQTWTPLGDHTLSQGTGTANNPGQVIKLDRAAAQYVRLIAKNTYGGAVFGLSEVHFYYVPTKASRPEPAAGAEDLDPAVTLSWHPGREAASHHVYLDTDPNAVADETTSFTTSSTDMLDLGVLDLGQTYYWKVVEINEAEVPAAWPSDVWDFSTTEFISVDNFESYTDEPGEEVFTVWADGYGIAGNGSQVTYDNPPYMETTIVHGGDQSMPYYYGRDGAANSEATMDVGGSNWTYGNAKTLVLYFHGDVENDPAQLYVKIGTTRINYPGDSAGLAAPLWKQWNIDLAGISASRVASFTIGVDGPGEGLLFIDDIRLYNEAPAMPGPAVDPGQDGLQAYYPMDNGLADASGNNRAGSAEDGVGFGDGPIGYGQAMTVDGTDTAYATIPVGSVIEASDSMTIAAWVRRDATGQNQRIFDFGNDTDVYMFMSPSSGGVRFAITTGSYQAESSINSANAISSNSTWHHVAITIDGATAEMKLYVDGNLAATELTETLPSDLGNTANNWISRSQWSADPYLEGAIDEFRIYNRALSDAEVRYLVGDR